MSEEKDREAYRRFLTFKIGDEKYAIPVSAVREVLTIPRVTRVPKSKRFLRGVINLRGSVVTVLDLKDRMGLDPCEETVDARIIVLDLTVEGQDYVLGVMTEKVEEVLDIPINDISEKLKLSVNISEDFISGIGKKNGQFYILLKEKILIDFDKQ